jgi:hypothetical protein
VVQFDASLQLVRMRKQASRPLRAQGGTYSLRAIFEPQLPLTRYRLHQLPAFCSAVATSKSPFGPFFTIANDTALSTEFGHKCVFGSFTFRAAARPFFYLPARHDRYNNSNVGDFSLFKDDDGTACVLSARPCALTSTMSYPSLAWGPTYLLRASYPTYPSPPCRYILYSSNAHAQIERLTPDYYSSTWIATNDTSGVFPHGNEAPAMFKNNGIYYALISDSCCYCGQGGQVRAFQAYQPLGPYNYTGDITVGPNPFKTGGVTTSSQQTNVFRVGDQLVWQGDRWQSAPTPNRFKGEDFTAMFLLGFNADGSVQNITWADNITIRV